MDKISHFSSLLLNHKERERERENARVIKMSISASSVSSFLCASSSSVLRGGRNGGSLCGRKMMNDLSRRKTSFPKDDEDDEFLL